MMKLILASALAAAALFAAPAQAQGSDPKVDFLGYCVQQGQPITYCGCLTDQMAAALTPREFAIYTYSLKLIGSGERDPKKIRTKLKEYAGVDGPALSAMLKKANDASSAAQKVCAAPR